MAWCRQATSHCLSQCWPRYLSPSGVSRPRWDNKPPTRTLESQEEHIIGTETCEVDNVFPNDDTLFLILNELCCYISIVLRYVADEVHNLYFKICNWWGKGWHMVACHFRTPVVMYIVMYVSVMINVWNLLLHLSISLCPGTFFFEKRNW